MQKKKKYFCFSVSNTERFHYEFKLDNITMVLLAEKALNLFNSELFDEWVKEEQKKA